MEHEPLRPQFVQAQKTLQMALDEACAVDLDEADTGELIRVEETLALASKAAKQAVSVRLRLRSQREGGGDKKQRKTPRRASAAVPAAPADVVPPITHRVFDDLQGKRWHAFAVHATGETVDRARLPEAFRQGWLLFESGDELRRVAPIPERWEELSIDDLRLLCYKAASAPRRTGSRAPEKREPPIDS